MTLELFKKKRTFSLLHPLRKYYEERYKKRFRLARILFMIDAILLGIIVALGGALVFIITSTNLIKINIEIPARTSPVLLQLRIDAPPTILRGSETEIGIFYENTGATALPNPTLSINTSEGMELSNQKETLELGDVAAGASGTLRLTGIVREPQARLAVEATVLRGNRKVIVGSAAKTLESTPSDITISHRYTGADSVRPGDTLTFEVGYENTGAYKLEQTTLGLQVMNPEMIDWMRTTIAKRVSSSFLGLTAAELPALTQSSSGTAATVSLPILTNITKTMLPDGRDAVLRVRARVTGLVNGTPVAFVGKIKEIKIASALSIEALARYFSPDGDQLGRGALPPVVGSPTKLWIIWHVQNTTNEVRRVRVSGTLPEHVTWTEHVSVTSGGAVTYNQQTRRVTWDILVVPPFSDDGEPLGASFEVTLTPTGAMVGTTPVLLHDIAISGEDALTGLELASRAADVTTDLTHDIFGRGKGVVQE